MSRRLSNLTLSITLAAWFGVANVAAAGENTNADVLPCEIDKSGKHHEVCRLTSDVVLTSPVRLASGTTLDCQGFALLPQTLGIADIEATTTCNATTHLCNTSVAGFPTHACTTNADCDEYRPSSPEVGVLIKGSRGVELKNCVIGTDDRAFDFGVLVLDTKLSSTEHFHPSLRNRIVGNSITSKYAGVTLVKADGTHVADNAISFGVGSRGRGVQVMRDSDQNKVSDNIINAHSFGPIRASTGRVLFREIPQNNTRQGAGARAILSLALNAGVLSFVYDGELTQVPITRDMLVTEGTWLGACVAGRCTGDATQTCIDDLDCGVSPHNLTQDLLSENNVYDSNSIDFGVNANVGHLGNSGVATFGSVNDKITNNTVLACEDAFHFSAQAQMTISGTCSLNSSRFCASNEHCNIPGFDTTSNGTCVGSRALPSATVNIGTKNALVENNTVVGPSRVGITVSRGTVGVMVIGNHFSGATAVFEDNAPVAGIAISNNALESVQIVRNIVHDNAVSFRATSPGARDIERPRFYGAAVTLNDFTQAQISQTALTCTVSEVGGGTPASCFGTCPAGQGVCTRGFTQQAELSSDGRGNYWGRTCEDSDGFRDAHEPDANGQVDSLTLLTTDSHPYGVPVALADNLPQTCK